MVKYVPEPWWAIEGEIQIVPRRATCSWRKRYIVRADRVQHRTAERASDPDAKQGKKFDEDRAAAFSVLSPILGHSSTRSSRIIVAVRTLTSVTAPMSDIRSCAV